MEAEKIANTEPAYLPNKRQNSEKSISLPIIQTNPNNSNSVNTKKAKNRKLFFSLDKKSSKNKNIKIKRRMPTAKKREKRIKINADLDLVNKLNMELEVDELFEEESRLQKQKEKIESNPDIISRRLNIFKTSTDNDDKKIEVDSKEKEKYIEKEFKDELEAFTKIKNECMIINEKINQLRETIDDHQLELNVFDKYGEELDKKYALEIQEKEKNKILETALTEESNKNKELNMTRNEKFEYLNSLAQLKKKRD